MAGCMHAYFDSFLHHSVRNAQGQLRNGREACLKPTRLIHRFFKGPPFRICMSAALTSRSRCH